MSVIVLDHGQQSIEVRDGVKIIKSVRSNLLGRKPGRLLSMLYSYVVAPFLFWRSLRRAGAGIYLQKMVGPSSALAALFCLLKKRIFIYSVSSDIELEAEDLAGEGWLARFLCQFAIKRANAIIAQTEYQRNLLKSKFNRDGLLIKNMYPLPPEKPEKEKPPILLWVATIRERKQPEMFLDLARAIPEARFQMIGGPAPENPQYSEGIKRAAIVIPNLDFVGFVPYHKVEQYFDRASIFVNTSAPDSEGFPNTFLQAWARYTPVVSLNCDPDEIICEKRLGFHSGTFEQAVNEVKLLLKNEKMRSEIGANGRKYVEEEHDIEKIISRYIGLFEQLTGQGDSVRRRMITL